MDDNTKFSPRVTVSCVHPVPRGPVQNTRATYRSARLHSHYRLPEKRRTNGSSSKRIRGPVRIWPLPRPTPRLDELGLRAHYQFAVFMCSEFIPNLDPQSHRVPAGAWRLEISTVADANFGVHKPTLNRGIQLTATKTEPSSNFHKRVYLLSN